MVDRGSLLLFVEEGPRCKKRLMSMKDCYALMVRNIYIFISSFTVVLSCIHIVATVSAGRYRGVHGAVPSVL